jgi:uncharacterized protein YqeY
MTIAEKIDADIKTAMRARDEHRLTTLRMVKSALKSKEIDKREALTEQEGTAVLSTLLKQRRESIDQFTKGGRPELAEKEQMEIGMIEIYMPQAAGEDQVREIVQTAIAHLAASGDRTAGGREAGFGAGEGRAEQVGCGAWLEGITEGPESGSLAKQLG